MERRLAIYKIFCKYVIILVKVIASNILCCILTDKMLSVKYTITIYSSPQVKLFSTNLKFLNL